MSTRGLFQILGRAGSGLELVLDKIPHYDEEDSTRNNLWLHFWRLQIASDYSAILKIKFKQVCLYNFNFFQF